MARMIPDRIPDDAPPSEKLIFDNLKRAPHSTDWTVFHSEYVKNPKHPVKPREIDFLILMRPSDNSKYCGIVCLEAKGGSWRRNKGLWYRMSSRAPEKQSPPDQARGAMFAFKKEFKAHFQPSSLLSIGCAVAFTDAEYLTGEERTQPALIIEKPDAQDPDRLSRILADHAAELPTNAVRRRLEGNPRDWLEALEAIDNLQRELEESVMITTRPERIIRQDLETLGEELLRLTTEQFDCLEQIQSEWNDRCVIAGAAGTGKTVLAMELARRLSHEGNNVALLCSNPYLSSRFQRWTKTLPKENGGRVVAGTPATLPLEALSADETLRNRHQARLNASPKLAESLKPGVLNDKWREFIKETIKDLSQVEPSFDYLIVDEAQNLCDDVFLDSMDAMLGRGLKDGNWTMFGDFEYQHILNRDKKDGRKKLRSRGINFFANELKINCRNTYEIAAAFAMFADIVSPPRSGVHGPIIQTEFFKCRNEQDELEERDELLTRLVENLQEREFFSRQIVLLANDNGDLGNATQIADWKLQNIRDATADTPLDSERALTVSSESFRKKLRYSDIYDFQGLESDAVILVMPLTERQSVLGGEATMPHNEHLRRILYTGMSRAKAMLIIVAHKSYKEFLKLDSIYGRSYEDHIELLRDIRNRLT